MKIDDLKLKRQAEGRDKWEANKFDGIINWFTGVGKSFYLMYEDGFISKYLEVYPKATVLVISNNKINSNKLVEYGDLYLKKYINQIYYVTIDELSKQNKDMFFNLLIADEVDNYTSEIRKKLINNKGFIRYYNFLGLTATLYLLKTNYNEFLKEHKVVDTINGLESTTLGYTCKTTEFNLGIDLPEYKLYTEYTRLIQKGIDRFIPIYKYVPRMGIATNNPSDYYKFKLCLNACMKGAYLDGVFYTANKWIYTLSELSGYTDKLNPILTKDAIIIQEYAPDKLTAFCFALNDAITKRDILIKNNDYKLDFTKQVILNFDLPETIVFGESTEFANKIYEYLNATIKENIAVLYHSKAKVPIVINGEVATVKSGKTKGNIKYYGVTPNSKGEVPLMEYNLKCLDTTAKVLVAVKGLSRGFNRPQIGLIVNVSRDESTTIYEQRIGRGVRLNPNSDVTNSVFIVNIYFKNTIDERKLKAIQKASGNDTNAIWISFSDGKINYNNEIAICL